MSRSTPFVLGIIMSLVCIALLVVYITNPDGVAGNVPAVWKSLWAVATIIGLVTMSLGLKQRSVREQPVKIGRF